MIAVLQGIENVRMYYIAKPYTKDSESAPLGGGCSNLRELWLIYSNGANLIIVLFL